jgi:hypothetical protein
VTLRRLVRRYGTDARSGWKMSSADLNNEDYFSDRPKRLPSFDDLFRTESHLSPDRFFHELEQRFSDHDFSQDDYQRAVFLFRRLQSARRIISRLVLLLVTVSAVPFVCLILPEEWRLAVFICGISLELAVGLGLFFAQSLWQARRRDYCHWLRLVHRRIS